MSRQTDKLSAVCCKYIENGDWVVFYTNTLSYAAHLLPISSNLKSLF